MWYEYCKHASGILDRLTVARLLMNLGKCCRLVARCCPVFSARRKCDTNSEFLTSPVDLDRKKARTSSSVNRTSSTAGSPSATGPTPLVRFVVDPSYNLSYDSSSRRIDKKSNEWSLSRALCCRSSPCYDGRVAQAERTGLQGLLAVYYEPAAS